MIEVQNALQLDQKNEQAAVLGAKIRLQLGGTRAAYRMLEGFTSGQSFDYYSTLAESYIQAHKYNSALALLMQNAVKFESQRTDLHLLQARAFAGLGNRQRAEELYDEALAESPGNPLATLGKLSLIAAAGDFVTAEERLIEFLQHSPRNFDALLLLAAVQFRAGDLDSAESSLSMAISELPTTDMFTRQRAGVLRALIDLLARQGRSAEALVYQRALDGAFPQNQINSEKIEEIIAKIDAQEYAGAEVLLNEIYLENPDYSTGGAMLGLLNYVQGNSEEAETYFTDSVDFETAAEPVLKAIAINYYRMNNPVQVVKTLKERIESSNDAFLIAMYAMAALKIGDNEAGELFMTKAIDLAPSNGALRVRLARYYATRLPPEDQKALNLLKEGIQIRPDSWRLRIAEIDQLLSMDLQVEAQEALVQLPIIEGQEELLSLTRAAFFQQVMEYDRSTMEYQSVLVGDPQNVIALYGLAYIHFKRSQFDQGVLKLEQLLKVQPDSRRALVLALEEFQAIGELERGVQFVERYGKENDYLSTVVLSNYLTDIGAVADASKYVEVLAQRNRSAESQRLNAKVNYARALEFAQKKQYEKARSAIFNALGSYPLNVTLLKTLTRLEIDAGQHGEAEKILIDLRARQGNSPLVLELAGDLAFAQKLFSVALSSYTKAWPDRISDSLGIKISALYGVLNDQQGLAVFVENWRLVDPASQLAMINEVEYSAALGIELYVDFLAEYPASPLIRNNLALLLFDAGSVDRALEMSGQAVGMAPGNASVLDTHGWLLYRSGDRAAALQLLTRAAALAPGNSAIAANLAEVQKSPR
jgi:tetratricopeptide (TPR) repeat protein